MQQENLPPNCPMKKADYEHYCPSPDLGPEAYKATGHCTKEAQCEKLVKDFKEMRIETSSKLFKKLGI